MCIIEVLICSVPPQVWGWNQWADQWRAWNRLSHHRWHPQHDPSGSQTHTQRHRYNNHTYTRLESPSRHQQLTEANRPHTVVSSVGRNTVTGSCSAQITHYTAAQWEFRYLFTPVYQKLSASMFSLSMMVGLVPIVSLIGLFYSAAVDENFPQGCTSSNSLCFYSLLLPVTIPVYVFFHLWSWMGIKLFRHN